MGPVRSIGSAAPRLSPTWVDHLLRLYGGVLGSYGLFYTVLVFVEYPRIAPWLLGFFSAALLAIGWLPAFARSPRQQHGWLTLAALAALPLSRPVFDGPMHDLPIFVPALALRGYTLEERLRIDEAAPFLLFGPLALLSFWRWRRLRRAP